MNNTYYQKMKKYINKCSTKQKINWYDLSKSCYLLMNQNDDNQQRVKLIKKLVIENGKNKKLNQNIMGIRISMKKGFLKLKLPINLNHIEYVRLYSLMLSEGSFKKEFSINVPEKFFHQIFKNSLKKLISNNILIKKDFNNNHERSRAPSIIRNILPFPNHLSLILFKNKDFAREYLRIAFEVNLL